MRQNNANGNCIIVIPFIPFDANIIYNPLKIDKLYFWYKNTFDHPVNSETLRFFLFHAHLYGATVYPECPELGCIAVNNPASLSNGEKDVNEISYNGEVIYSGTNNDALKRKLPYQIFNSL